MFSITLDYYCKKNKIKKIDILKSDTQGCDLNVLKVQKNSFQNINFDSRDKFY